MTVIISAPSFKGGVGKTTTIVHLAAACARAGLHTIVIDADMQGNAASMMGVQREDGFYDLIAGGKDWSDVLRTVPREFANTDTPLMVLPGGLQTTTLKKHDLTVDNMVDLIGLLRGYADVVLIDTAPGFDDIHAGMYAVSDYVILPTQCEEDSIESLPDTFTLLSASLAVLPRVAQIMGILPTMVNKEVNAHLLGMDKLRMTYRRQYAIFAPIYDLVAFKDARTRQMSIYAHLETIPQTRGMGRRLSKPSATKAVEAFDNAIARQVIAMAREKAAVA